MLNENRLIALYHLYFFFLITTSVLHPVNRLVEFNNCSIFYFFSILKIPKSQQPKQEGNESWKGLV